MKRVQAACICQTLLFFQKDEPSKDRNEKLSREEIEKYKKSLEQSRTEYKALESTVLFMVREIVFSVGFALLLPLKFGLDGVLYSMPLSDILTFLIAVFLICQTYKEHSGTTAKSMEIGNEPPGRGSWSIF